MFKSYFMWALVALAMSAGAAQAELISSPLQQLINEEITQHEKLLSTELEANFETRGSEHDTVNWKFYDSLVGKATVLYYFPSLLNNDYKTNKAGFVRKALNNEFGYVILGVVKPSSVSEQQLIDDLNKKFTIVSENKFTQDGKTHYDVVAKITVQGTTVHKKERYTFYKGNAYVLVTFTSDSFDTLHHDFLIQSFKIIHP